MLTSWADVTGISETVREAGQAWERICGRHPAPWRAVVRLEDGRGRGTLRVIDIVDAKGQVMATIPDGVGFTQDSVATLLAAVPDLVDDDFGGEIGPTAMARHRAEVAEEQAEQGETIENLEEEVHELKDDVLVATTAQEDLERERNALQNENDELKDVIETLRQQIRRLTNPPPSSADVVRLDPDSPHIPNRIGIDEGGLPPKKGKGKRK